MHYFSRYWPLKSSYYFYSYLYLALFPRKKAYLSKVANFYMVQLQPVLVNKPAEDNPGRISKRGKVVKTEMIWMSHDEEF